MKISVGAESFEALRQSGGYYVDKTELIYDLVNANNTVTLFTRPRRFGKTLTMSMLESFFDCSRDSRAVFDGLAIFRHTEFCDAWMNQYPVIFLTLKDVEGIDFSGALGMLKSVLAKLCIKMESVVKRAKLNQADVDIFDRMMFRKIDVEEVKNSIDVLTRILYTIYSKPVILLIDEYDVPLAKAQENGYYREMLDVIRGMFSVGLKTNDYLKFGVVTGCLRISKESIFTGVNNFSSYSVLSEDFSEYFGFTHGEVEEMLAEAGMGEKSELIRSWYDGYVFGNSYVYCPWDVVSYVAALLRRPNAMPENYWKNTSGNGILRTFIENAENNVTVDFETLMNGGTIQKTITQELAYDALYDNEDNLWSVLLMTGYVTKADPTNPSKEDVELRIPNREISSIFQDTVVAHFRRGLNRDAQREMVQAFWDEDEDRASEKLSNFLWQTISYNDYHEDYYHAFLAGIFVGLGYAVESNKEHGKGRPDILLKDKMNRRALIIEGKTAKNKSEIEAMKQEAVDQIVRERYWKGLDGYRTILCYGVCFYQKEAYVKEMKMSTLG